MEMTTFVALFRDRTIHDAQVVAVSINARLAQQVAATMLTTVSAAGDEILDPMDEGRKKALQRVAGLTGQRAPVQAGAPSAETARKGGENLHDADPSA